ncbi:hypothetical protein BSKO_03900 [Bryopsis sp. KO-2023]|nr:hypothetical protein BSKO_03900 [Bryopsis sp. KO-2023]
MAGSLRSVEQSSEVASRFLEWVAGIMSGDSSECLKKKSEGGFAVGCPDPASPGVESGEDDWEAQLDNGEDFQCLGPAEKGNSGRKDDRMTRGRGALDSNKQAKEVQEREPSDEVPSWEDAILGRDSCQPDPPVSLRPRPETTTVVARRFLAQALNRPELVARGEERALNARRERNKKERQERKQNVDAVWDE